MRFVDGGNPSPRMLPKSVMRWVLFAWFATYTVGFAAPTTSPDEYIDAQTGHRVVRLSRRTGDNSLFYFHQNCYTADGDKMVFVGSTDQGPRAFTVDLHTYAVRQITKSDIGGHAVVAPRHRELFYLNGDTIVATHVDSGETRRIADLPPYYKYGRGLSINANETLLAGCYAKGEQTYYSSYPRTVWMDKLFEAKLPNALYTVDVKTGKTHEFLKTDAWLGHVQFSPTDPTLVMFCHEGPERRLDRIWLIRSDGSDMHMVCQRRGRDVLVTHEFWQPDGKKIWFDLQIPRYQGDDPAQRALAWARGPHYYLASIDVKSGQEARYGLLAQESSWHYNVSPEGRRFCGGGDGRDPLRGGVGKWIYLFEPGEGKMVATRLCGLAGHDYITAPMVRFTPDGKWVVFQARQHGSTQVYAVEVARH
jgi:oligogalacturonide lyase